MLVQKSVTKLADRVTGEKKEQVFDAWNNTQSFFIQTLIKSYAELFILNGFLRMNEVADHQNTKIMLDKFLVLYALNSIEADIGLFREDDYVTSEGYDLIKNEILELCKDLSNEFISIIDVISPSDMILGSPLGASNDDVKYKMFNYTYIP